MSGMSGNAFSKWDGVGCRGERREDKDKGVLAPLMHLARASGLLFLAET